MNKGDVDVIALSDGTVGLQVLDGLLLNAKSGEVQSLLGDNYQKSPINASINAFLIRLAGRLILVDAGSAELVGPTTNKLPDSLRAVGVQREQITDIFLTHIHPDHSGGLMEGNKKVFPNAIIQVDIREVTYWFDKSIAETAAEPLKTFSSQVDPKVKPYLDSGQLKRLTERRSFFRAFDHNRLMDTLLAIRSTFSKMLEKSWCSAVTLGMSKPYNSMTLPFASSLIQIL